MTDRAALLARIERLRRDRPMCEPLDTRHLDQILDLLREIVEELTGEPKP